MSEISVTLSGQSYLVRGEGRDATVLVVVNRRPASPRGVHPNDTVYRTIKYGTATWKAAVKQAAYERSLVPGGR